MQSVEIWKFLSFYLSLDLKTLLNHSGPKILTTFGCQINFPPKNSSQIYDLFEILISPFSFLFLFLLTHVHWRTFAHMHTYEHKCTHIYTHTMILRSVLTYIDSHYTVSDPRNVNWDIFENRSPYWKEAEYTCTIFDNRLPILAISQKTLLSYLTGPIIIRSFLEGSIFGLHILGDYKLWGGNPEDFSPLLINIQIWPSGSALFLMDTREREHMDSIFE